MSRLSTLIVDVTGHCSWILSIVDSLVISVEESIDSICGNK
ncbi:MAG: hypothetical protein V9G25_02020 [Acidimicrobiia bacterium]